MNIMVTGGGTGGHVFPALAISKALKQRGHRILYIGSDRGLEAKLAPQYGIDFKPIHMSGLKNMSVVRKIKTLLLLVRALFTSLRQIRQFQADAIVGVGGYVSAPVCLAGWMMRKPVFLQEQNVTAGMANRCLSLMASQIFLGFEKARGEFQKDKCLWTGNPLREEFYTTSFASPSLQPTRLLVLGGSLGARTLNYSMVALLPQLRKSYPLLQIEHQTGPHDYEFVKNAYLQIGWAHQIVEPFFHDMADRLNRCSFLISRSGALAVSEIVHVKRPAIFVPYPRKGKNDQTSNAYLMQGQGMAMVEEQGEGFQSRLLAAIDHLMEPKVFENMKDSLSKAEPNSALDAICDAIELKLGVRGGK